MKHEKKGPIRIRFYLYNHTCCDGHYNISRFINGNTLKIAQCGAFFRATIIPQFKAKTEEFIPAVLVAFLSHLSLILVNSRIRTTTIFIVGVKEYSFFLLTIRFAGEEVVMLGATANPYHFAYPQGEAASLINLDAAGIVSTNTICECLAKILG